MGIRLTALRNAVTSRVGRQILIGQKHSPTILFVAGTVGVVAAAVLASRATLKLDEVLTEHEKTKLDMDLTLKRPNNNYTEELHRRDGLVLMAKTAGRITKLYAPAVVVGALSIAALTGSHVVLTRRNAAVMAAYAAIDKGFREYRDRVVAKYGPEEDQHFRYGEQIETELSEDTDLGTKVQKVKVLGGKNVSIYARFFDESSPSWDRAPHYNQFFIQCQQNYANDKLRAQGHLFLNEVYDMLGLERSPEGAVVGWVLNGGGDCFVDFGVFNGDKYMGQEFVNGSERSILLDFNVDGVIWDKI